jgi:hypothetical protein
MKHTDQIDLLFHGGRNKLAMTLTRRGRLDARIGRHHQGSFAIDRSTVKIIFSLAEIVVQRDRKRAVVFDAAFKEIAAVSVSLKGKRSRYTSSPTGPGMSDYLRLLTREMSGLIKW